MTGMRGMRPAAGLALGLLLALQPVAVAADDCDWLRGETISFVVPYSPGGGNDLLSRLLEPYLERHSGAELVVSNISGGGGAIGFKAIRDAKPDGRTIGIVGATTLLLGRLLGNAEMPNVVEDYHILGQLAYDGRLMGVAVASPIHGVDDLWAASPARGWVAGLASADGVEAIVAAGTVRLLGFDLEIVSGFRGSKEVSLALLRGDVDITFRTIESALPAIEAGEIRPILLFAEQPDATQPALAGVPALGGGEGVAARRAAELGRLVSEAIEQARAYGEIAGQRRLVVAPRGLDAGLGRCLDSLYLAAVTDPGFVSDVAMAGRALDVLSGDEVRPRIEAAAKAAATLPLVEDARQAPR